MAEIDDTYAEAFRSVYAEILVTARDRTCRRRRGKALIETRAGSCCRND